MKSYGQVAYEAYFTISNGKSLISGSDLLSWDSQSETIQAAWEYAAKAVLDFRLSRETAVNYKAPREE